MGIWNAALPDCHLVGFFSGGEFGPMPIGERGSVDDPTVSDMMGFTTVFTALKFGYFARY